MYKCNLTVIVNCKFRHFYKKEDFFSWNHSNQNIMQYKTIYNHIFAVIFFLLNFHEKKQSLQKVYSPTRAVSTWIVCYSNFTKWSCVADGTITFESWSSGGVHNDRAISPILTFKTSSVARVLILAIFSSVCIGTTFKKMKKNIISNYIF